MTITQTGMYPDMTMDDYHADPALGSSMLKAINRNEYYFYKNYIEQKPDDLAEPAQFTFGRAAHKFLLEPEGFSDTYALMPEGMIRRGKAYDELVSNNAGKEFIPFKDYQVISRMADSLSEPCHSIAAATISMAGSFYEESIFWQHPDGIMCKARFDLRNPHTKIIADLKTAVSAEFNAFQRAIINYQYDLSAFWYTQGAKEVFGEEYDYIWIVVEKDYPHCWAVYQAHPDVMERGRQGAVKAIAKYQDAIKRDQWQGYADEVVTMFLPDWASKTL